ncbi:hypothetical protein RchiOBHm_Chr7g0209891 [Rosa chinensis]|uniref:Uncharacterized protein n=1 Tax=Rosa chinensis TaxID=74649 RepID=A0A2P6PA42_ROSCH|nr:hypothetical protein RchiOBHm_Chr7g0209891 [Rosa chinensis]
MGVVIIEKPLLGNEGPTFGSQQPGNAVGFGVNKSKTSVQTTQTRRAWCAVTVGLKLFSSLSHAL